MTPSPFTRRAFLQTGLTLLSSAATVPAFISRSALGLSPDPSLLVSLTSLAGVPQDRILVVIQLAGGNDGLNTVVPYGMDAYYRARPAIAIQKNNVLRLSGSEDLGMHPSLGPMKDLYDQGLLSLVQGVGYPNPNRSHFTSTDIWSSGDPLRPNGTGWIGRYFDCTCKGSPDPAGGIALGRNAPHAMLGDSFKPVSFETPDLFRWLGGDVDPGLETRYESLLHSGAADVDRAVGAHSPEGQLDFLTRTALDARAASAAIRKAVEVDPLVQYPGNPLAPQLRMVAAMIRAGLPTRVYYVTLGGFDTHSAQPGTHANLLSSLASSLKAFYEDLKKQGNDARVLTMTFSEFGRRVGQNASNGTDHGTAAPMFLAGPMVRPGVIGNHPSLTDLDEGDLKYALDFRSVYAGILQDWLKSPIEPVLGGPVRPALLIKSA